MTKTYFILNGVYHQLPMWSSTKIPLYYGGIPGEGDYDYSVVSPITTAKDNTNIKETGS